MSSQSTYKPNTFSSQNKPKNTPVFHSSFTGKEKDSETGYYYFGARYYNSDFSIWLSVDPMADKYPSLSPYNYCAWNPMRLVDPNGDTLDLVGGKQAQIDILSIVDPKYQNRISFNNNRVCVNTNGLSIDEIEQDAGFSTVNNLVNSQYNYMYNVSEKDNSGNPVDVQTNSITPHMEFIRNSDPLPNGYQGQVIVNPTLTEIPYEGATPVNNRPSTIFHELEECFQRTDNKHPHSYLQNRNRDVIDPNRKGAHQLAVDKSARLTESARSKTGLEGRYYKYVIK